MLAITPDMMRTLEKQAFSEGFSDELFMENAGKGVADKCQEFIKKTKKNHRVILLAGKGNNAGDGFVAGRHLLDKGFDVICYHTHPADVHSELVRKMRQLFIDHGGKIAKNPDSLFKKPAIILDALFGTGFKGIPKEPFASIIEKANLSRLPILSIDIPSGLDAKTGIVEKQAIKATKTFFLGLPKTGFFLQDGWTVVGKLEHVDFGLPKSIEEQATSDLFLLEKSTMHARLPEIINNRHKYQAGFVVALAGSPGMPGAAILATHACLKAGAGIVKLLHPKSMEQELSSSLPEVIKVAYSTEDLKAVTGLIEDAGSILIGPGIGRSNQTKKLIRSVLETLEKPAVLDADALTIVAEEKISLPKNLILTPHIGEMIKLFHKSSPKPGTRDFLNACQDFAEEKEITLVLKGGPTFIFCPGEPILINSFADPGQATAGSGDVLTGIIAALLSERLKPKEAAILGVYLHGRSGEIAAEDKSSYCLIASDLIEYLPKAVLEIL